MQSRYGILMSIDILKYSDTRFIVTMVRILIRKQAFTLDCLDRGLLLTWAVTSDFECFNGALINKIRGDELWHVSLGRKGGKERKNSFINNTKNLHANLFRELWRIGAL